MKALHPARRAAIPYARQSISSADVAAVARALRSDFLTQGPAVPAFERAVSRRCGAEHAVAVNSATSALHLGCLALGLGPGDTLWTTPNTFVASANCALYCGASVDFVDIDPSTWNLSTLALRRKLVSARRKGQLPKVVVPVHFAGQPCEQEEIMELAVQFGFKVLEDASHALGAARHGEPVGSCRWSHATVLSFHPVKIITSVEGGMLLTNDTLVAQQAASLRSHGISRDPRRLTRAPDGPWYYEQLELGFNFRLTDVQAALGTSQLGRLDDFIACRNRLARRYDRALRGLPLRLPTVRAGNLSAFHLYVARLDRRRAGISHADLHAAMRAEQIGVNLHYMPVHLQPYYRKLGFRPRAFPEAERYATEAITLPLYPGLTDADQDRVVRTLRRLLR
ncbi:MAG TPA: UDP-4-amino-4,6-dideoxy-N-acetyl-beta-L-altrosamine transaminase [Opitutaceae bacterium]|nr:UDP-4-amino-4,6-dideoxy-N-acetyl-beta-L-altrosamine transaminase [Opitutaceae bacterium]